MDDETGAVLPQDAEQPTDASQESPEAVTEAEETPQAPSEPVAADTGVPLVSDGLHPDHAPPRVPGVGAEPYTSAEHIHVRETGEQPVHVDQYTRRSDDDVLAGHMLKVVSGDHAGEQAAFVKVDRYGPDGYPERIVVRFTNARYSHEYAGVDYADVRPV